MIGRTVLSSKSKLSMIVEQLLIVTTVLVRFLLVEENYQLKAVWWKCKMELVVLR